MTSKLMLRIYNLELGERALIWLEDIDTKSLRDNVYFTSGHRVSSEGGLAYKPIESNLSKLSEVLNDEASDILMLPTDEYSPRSNLRIISTEKALNIDVNIEGSEPVNLVMMSVDYEFPGWRSDRKAGIPVRLYLPNQSKKILTSAVSDILLDIQIANSYSTWPTVQNAVNQKGHAWLYREKVKFILGLGISESLYGPVDESSGYVSFCSVARMSNPEKYTLEVVRLWDDFILSKLFSYIPDDQKLAKYLTKFPAIGGQLKSVEKIEHKLEALERDAHLMLFANKLGKYETQFKTNPKLPRAKRGSVSIISSKQIDLQIQRYLREGVLHAIKFYKS